MTRNDAAELRHASTRLALSFAGLMIALVAVVGIVVFTVVIAGQNASLRATLANSEHLDSPHDAPPGTFLAIVNNGQTQVSGDAPPDFPDRSALETVTQHGGTIEKTQTFGGRQYVVRTDGDSGRVIQVAVDQHESQEELQRLLLAFIAAGALAVIFAGVAGWFMSRWAMRPMADALALQRRFVADASHELRTPLTLLSTRVQLIRRRLPRETPADVASGIDETVQDAKALTEILEDLLVAADPREAAEHSEVDLGEVVDNVVAAVAPEASSREITLTRAPLDRPIRVTGAPIALTRMLMALTVNAVDHAQREVSITVAGRGSRVIISVEDDGPGFPEGNRSDLFARFASSRGGPAADQGTRHYGLGLALVAEVAARHRGTVEIGATASGGGKVSVSLPR